MHFTKLAALAVLLGSALARTPGTVYGKKREAKRHIEARSCSHNNLLRALIRGGAPASSYCSSYLGRPIVATVTTTVPGGATTVEVVVTETPVVTDTVTEIGTVVAPVLARRQATPTIPPFLSAYANDTRMSSECACLLTTTIPGGSITVTVIGPASTTVDIATTLTLNTSTATATTFETTTITGPSTTVDLSSASSCSSTWSSIAPSPTCTAPIQGCVFGSSIIVADLITEATDCQPLCEATSDCVAYQVGTDTDSVVAYCELLNTVASSAYDSVGSLGSAEYCNQFFIYNVECPVIPGNP